MARIFNDLWRKGAARCGVQDVRRAVNVVVLGLGVVVVAYFVVFPAFRKKHLRFKRPIALFYFVLPIREIFYLEWPLICMLFVGFEAPNRPIPLLLKPRQSDTLVPQGPVRLTVFAEVRRVSGVQQEGGVRRRGRVLGEEGAADVRGGEWVVTNQLFRGLSFRSTDIQGRTTEVGPRKSISTGCIGDSH